MFELGVQLAACLMLWRVVRCSSPSSAVQVQVGWLQSTRPLSPGRQVSQNAATCRRKIETELGRAGMGRVATTN